MHAIDQVLQRGAEQRESRSGRRTLTEDVVCRLPTGDTTHGIQAVKDAVAGAAAAFPHRGVQIDEAILGEGRAAIVYSLTMAHVGEFMGIAPTGKEVSITGVDIFGFTGDKISEISVFYNPGVIFAQLGIELRPA